MILEYLAESNKHNLAEIVYAIYLQTFVEYYYTNNDVPMDRCHVFILCIMSLSV